MGYVMNNFKNTLHVFTALEAKRSPPGLVCSECGETFHEDEANLEERTEPSEFWGSRELTHHHVLVCPACGSDQIDDVEET
jgi:hypothetical protein